jgi:hypothetical protein
MKGSEIKKTLFAGLTVLSLAVLLGCAHTIRTSGTVTDSGVPVKDAKVIVSVWTHGIFDRNVVKYGTKTGPNGSFSLSVDNPFTYAEVHLEVMAPNDRYFFNQYSRLPAGHMMLTLTNQWYSPAGRFTYEAFDGKWAGKTTWVRSNTPSNQALQAIGTPGAPQPER